MPRNVEVKARVRDMQDLQRRLQALAPVPTAVLEQRDVFFAVAAGRLKVRFEAGHAELIAYQRRDEARLRLSAYERVAVPDGDALCRALRQVLPQGGEVRKVRTLYLVDNVRLHVDHVTGLGDFLEIEAVVDTTHDEASCHEAARRLLQDLGIAASDLETRAYVDMLAAGADGH